MLTGDSCRSSCANASFASCSWTRAASRSSRPRRRRSRPPCASHA